MTIEGAIAELQNLINADDVPFYYDSVIEAVIETIIDECKPKMSSVGVGESKRDMLKDTFEEQRALTAVQMPWEQDKEWNNTVVSNVPENSWGVIATESRFNQTVQKDQATLLAELINRVTSLEATVEFVLEQLQVNMDEIQSKPTAETLVRPTAISSTEVPWWMRGK